MSEVTGERAPSLTTTVFAALFAAAAGFGAVYVSWVVYGNGGQRSIIEAPLPAAPEPQAAKVQGGAFAGLKTGEMTAFVAKAEPQPLPHFTFIDAQGAQKTLQDWRGKVVLLNLWATWCAPCKKEMPSLDRLNEELGGENFEVVAVSVDKADAQKAQAFLDETGAEGLSLYRDPTGKLGQTLDVPGMPASFLIGSKGNELGRLIGPAEWDSPEAKRLIEIAIAGAR